MVYHEWYTRYMALYKAQLKPRTREEYDRINRAYLVPVLGDLDVSQITPEDVQTVLIHTATHGGTRQAQAVYALIHAVMRRACRSRLINWNPVDAIDKPAHEQEQGKQLTDADYKAVLPLIRNNLPLSLALFAGLRRGEIAGLQWGDVDLSASIIHVRRQRQRSNGQIITITPKSASGCREIPIAPELLPILRKHFMIRPAEWILKHAPEYPGREWASMQERDVLLSQHYRLHDLRHTYGSRLILSGCNLRVVQYLMGHSSLEVTMRVYSHCTPDQAAKEAQRVYAASLH